MIRKVIMATTAVVLLGAMHFARAADRHVDIINKTGLTMTHFYASNSGTNSWEEDILGRDTLEDGEKVTIDINDGTGACKFDFKAVFENGATLEKGEINVCEISSYTYTR